MDLNEYTALFLFCLTLSPLMLVLAGNPAGLLINSDTGEISNMLVGTCQCIEKRCLAAVLITCQRKYHISASNSARS